MAEAEESVTRQERKKRVRETREKARKEERRVLGGGGAPLGGALPGEGRKGLRRAVGSSFFSYPFFAPVRTSE
jgi:hypothetical protein